MIHYLVRVTLRVFVGVVILATACSPVPGERLLITSGFTDQIFVLDAHTGRVTDSLSLDRRPGERDEPHSVTVSPDGSHFYATLSHGEPSLWKYESDGLRLVGRLTLPTNGASRIRLSPDGLIAAIPDYWLSGGGVKSRVAFVRTDDLTVLANPKLCPAPHDAVFSPSGDRVAVTCPLSDELVIIATAGFIEINRLTIGETGDRPLNAAWMPEGKNLLVTLANGSKALELEINKQIRESSQIITGSQPAQLAIAPGGSTVVVANRGSGSVTITTLDGARSTEIDVPGPHPHGVAFGQDPTVVYVTYEGDTRTLGGVVAIDVDTGEILWRTEVGSFTLGVAVLP